MTVGACTFPRPPRPPRPASPFEFWVWCERCLRWERTGTVGKDAPNYADVLLWESATRPPAADGCIHIYELAPTHGTVSSHPIRPRSVETSHERYRVMRRARPAREDDDGR